MAESVSRYTDGATEGDASALRSPSDDVPARNGAVMDAAELEGAESAAETQASSRPAPHESEIDRLQLRLNQLRSRIQAALPDGYEVDEVLRTADRHESEEVFEITSEIEVLEKLAGPLMVPGATPQPAFDAMPEIHTMADDLELPSERRAARWKWIVIAVVIMIALIAAAALVVPNL